MSVPDVVQYIEEKNVCAKFDESWVNIYYHKSASPNVREIFVKKPLKTNSRDQDRRSSHGPGCEP